MMAADAGHGHQSPSDHLPSEPLGEGGLVVAGISHSYRTRVSAASRFGRRITRRAAEPVHPVLHNITFTVPQGSLTAIVGPSGCGKSTLLRVLAGLERAESGDAALNGVRITGRPGSVAYHPQNDALLPWLRVIDNATLGVEMCGGERVNARARAMQLLELFGLSGFERAWPDELSGGMRQRVALMRTFLMPQGVLLLDEPFGALDALTRGHLQQWLLDILEHDRRPTLLVTHDVDEALLVADEVIVLGRAGAGVAHRELRPPLTVRRAEHESGVSREAARRIHAALTAIPVSVATAR